MKKIAELSIEKSIEAIKDSPTVMFKHGVWNKSDKMVTAGVIDKIKRSSYGADVYVDDSGMFYVCCPSEGDMW